VSGSHLACLKIVDDESSDLFFFDNCKHNILSSQVTSQSSEEDEITNRS
jgi:hypothetical protein